MNAYAPHRALEVATELISCGGYTVGSLSDSSFEPNQPVKSLTVNLDGTVSVVTPGWVDTTGPYPKVDVFVTGGITVWRETGAGQRKILLHAISPRQLSPAHAAVLSKMGYQDLRK
jgi:hypothetical protein